MLILKHHLKTIKLSSYIKSHLKSLFLLFLFLFSACKFEHQEKGSLLVKALSVGNYELYKVTKAKPLAIVASKTPQYNKEIFLSPGEYLVLADCSSQFVQVYPQEQTKLITYTLNFIPPQNIEKNHIFSLRCERGHHSRFRQNISNRYQLNILSEKRDILVNQSILKLDFLKKEDLKINEPHSISYDLASIWVKGDPLKIASKKYFVSPNNVNVAFTQAQNINSGILLLPGKYQISINGSQYHIITHGKENLEYDLSYIKIKLAKHISQKQYTSIWGRPFAIYLNAKHQLDFDEYFPILPGQFKLFLDTQNNFIKSEILAHETKYFTPQSVTVSRGCKKNDWQCLGKKEVLLYEDNKYYPFLTSTSDVAIMYFSTKDISLGMQSSKGIKFKIPKNKNHQEFKLGVLKLKPQLKYRKNYITDLVRVEGNEKKISGYSQDISYKHDSKLQLIKGSYKLVIYNRNYGDNVSRAKEEILIRIKGHAEESIEFPYYISEREFKKFEAKTQS